MLWAGDTRKRLLVNVEAYGGDVVLVSVTAPGRDVLPWDGDRIECGARERWNRRAPDNWRKLHRAAAQRAKRKHGTLTLLAWSWEYQRRGALHKHVILGVKTAAELAAAHEYVQALDELRHVHGFGYVDRGRKKKGGGRALEVVPAIRAARYVAKYLAKRGDDGALVISETVTSQDVPPLVVYVARAMTTQTGITMRYLRRWRLVHVLGHDPATGETATSIFIGTYLRLQRLGVVYGRVPTQADDDVP